MSGGSRSREFPTGGGRGGGQTETGIRMSIRETSRVAGGRAVVREDWRGGGD